MEVNRRSLTIRPPSTMKDHTSITVQVMELHVTQQQVHAVREALMNAKL